MRAVTPSRLRPSLVAVALLLPFLSLLTGPARAADPVPTTTYTWQNSLDAPDGRTVAFARVTSSSGVPTGSVTFFLGSSTTPAGPAVPVDATGLASQELPVGGFFQTYRAEFTGTNGYANSADDAGDPRPSTATAEPTILRLGGPGLLKLTLTMSANVTFADGTPREGYAVLFTLLGPAKGASGHPEMSPLYVPPVEVCWAVSDVHGLATCGGKAAGSALLSILTLGSWMNEPGFPNYDSTYVPIVSIAK